MSDTTEKVEVPADEAHMTPEEAYRILVAQDGWKRGHIFSITFRKVDGSLRSGRFTSRIPKEFIKGTGRKGWKADDRTGIAAEYTMLLAYDIDKREPRFIKLNMVTRIKREKEVFDAK